MSKQLQKQQELRYKWKQENAKKDVNGCPVGKHSSKTVQERSGQKNLRNK